MLENAIAFGIQGQENSWIRRSAWLFLLGEVIKSLEDHLHRNICKGAVQSFCNAVCQIYLNGIKYPDGPNLHLRAMDRSDPEVGQTELPFPDYIIAAGETAPVLRQNVTTEINGTDRTR